MDMDKQWVKSGAVCGILSMLFYFLAVAVPMPDVLAVVLIAHFGIFLAVGFIGLYTFLKITAGESVVISLMKLSGMVAGVVVTLMVLVQQALFFTYDKFVRQKNASEIVQLKQSQTMSLLNTVHLGLDIGWDLFISWAGILLGLAMFCNRLYAKMVAGSVVCLNVMLLAFNLYTFPTPPGDAGLVDLGPFVAVSYIFIFTHVWVKQRNLTPEKTQNPATY